MAVQTSILWELTDTLGGEANYSWVERGAISWKERKVSKTKLGEDYSDLAAVRRVKKEIGWNGLRCRVEKHGDMIVLYPRGLCQVCFITFHCFGSAS